MDAHLALQLLLLLLPPLAAQPAGPGLPACSGPGRELAARGGFLLCHDSTYRTAVWTAYELTPAGLLGAAARPSHFRRDHDIAGAAWDSDYRNSGFSRGHLVPASDQAESPESIAATFLLSNAVPMPLSLNAGKWRQLEYHVRRLAVHSERLLIVTGPVFCSGFQRIGASGVAVPCKLFKVVLASREEGLEAYAAVLPNTGNPAEPLDRFASSVDAVELLTGLDFFPNLPPEVQRALESVTAKLDPR
jgi:endonuclease G